MTFLRQRWPRRQGARVGTAAYGAVADFALWSLAGLALMAALHLVAASQLSAGAWIPAIAIYLAAAGLVGALLVAHYPHRALGWCNVVTLARGVLVAFLVTPLLFAEPGAMVVAALAALALALDGVDGWLARRDGLASAFGARFDMEVDAAFALVLSLLALATGKVGFLVLVLGATRYAFVAAGLLLPWLDAPLPERRSRKAVCVIQIAVLVAIQLPAVTAGVASAMTLAASLLLLLSFGRDILWLHRNRA